MAYKPYEESEALKKAQQALQAQLGSKPQDYRSAWEEALKQAMDSLLKREDFRYDAASDPLYQNYRQQYIKDGRLAMLDTLGQTQAMTGGYGNSYAQSAAQQAYSGQLQKLNDRLPELYQLALDQYGLEGQRLSDRLSLLQGREDADYSRWQDAMEAWNSQTSLLANLYSAQSKQDYDRYLSDRDYQLKLDQAAQEQQRWQAEFDQAQKQWEASQTPKTASNGGGSYSGNAGYDAATVRKAQAFVGTAVDGLWGKNSKAAAKAKGYGSLQAVVEAMNAGSAGNADAAYSVEDGVAAVKSMAATGVSEQQLNAYIAKLTVRGSLTQAQAEILRKQYISPQYYY